MLHHPHLRARPRTRRIAGRFAILGVAVPLSALAWQATAATSAPPARCETLFDSVTIEPDPTVTIVRDGDKISGPDCTGTGPVLGTVSDTKTIAIDGGGVAPTIIIDPSGGRFPASIRF